MHHLRSGILGLTLLAFLSGTAPAQQDLWYHDVETARREAERLNRPILVHFGAVWCGPCKQMEQQVLQHPKIKERLQGSVVGLKIDIDHEKHKHLVKIWNIPSVPTDIIVEPNAARLVESEGFRTLDQYSEMIDRASARYTKLLAERAPKTPNPISNAPDFGSNPNQFTNTGKAELMLQGFCPVTLVQTRQWEKGKTEFHSEYKGQLFRFVDAKARDEFLKTPDKFVPQFLGCDPVIAWNTDRAVAGSIEYGAFYDEKLYLFVSDENRKSFKSTPDKYLTTRVVLYVDQIESMLR